MPWRHCCHGDKMAPIFPKMVVSVKQCCQVPVFARIFTEITSVFRSTEMEWLNPQN